MAQGRRPACCCLSEECLLSGKKGSTELKVTLGLKGPTAGGRERSWPLFGFILATASWFVLCQQRAPSGAAVLSFAKTKLAASLSRCLLFVQLWLFIYSVLPRQLSCCRAELCELMLPGCLVQGLPLSQHHVCNSLTIFSTSHGSDV